MRAFCFGRGPLGNFAKVRHPPPRDQIGRRLASRDVAGGAAFGAAWRRRRVPVAPGRRPYDRATMNTERQDPPLLGSERATLVSFLDWHRATLAVKCEGLSDDQLRRQSMPPSTLSLLGLVRHMAEVERTWFRRVLDRGGRAPRLLGHRRLPGGVRRTGGRRRGGVRRAGGPRSSTPAGSRRPHRTSTSPATRPRGARTCRCAGCSSTWSRSTPGTTGTPTCCVRGWTAGPGA